MAEVVFAICRKRPDELVKRVPLSAEVQGEVTGLFLNQLHKFLNGRIERVPYNGFYKANDDEVLVLEQTEEIKNIINQASKNPTAVPILNTQDLHDEQVRSLFCKVTYDGKELWAFQPFSTRNILSHKFALWRDDNQFREMKEGSFILSDKLCVVIDGEDLLFTSTHALQSITYASAILFEATDASVKSFFESELFKVEDVEQASNATNSVTRKLIYQISESETLIKHTVEEIVSAASELGVELNVSEGRIVIPTDKARLKELLQILSEARFSGSITKSRYLTSGHRKLA